MTSAALERSLEQRMEALGRANEIRVKRAVLKRDLKAGRASIADVLLDPPAYVHSAKVFDLLMAAPKFGRVKVNHVLHLCRISPSKTIGGLSPRQRTELVSMLRRRPGRGMERPLARPAGGTLPETQHMRALAHANSTRLERAALKRQVADGRLTVATVLYLPPAAAESMTIVDLLMCQHRWGRTRCRRFLASIPMLETKTLVSMSPRQRDEVRRRLDASYRPDVRRAPTPTPSAVKPLTPTKPVEPEATLSEVYELSHRLHLAPAGGLVASCGLEPWHKVGCRLVADREWTQRPDDRCARCVKGGLVVDG